MTNKLLFGLFLSAYSSAALNAAETAKAWVEASLENNILMVDAYIKGAKDASLRFELISEKSGASGNSRTKQSGIVLAKRDSVHSLTKLRLGYAQGDEYVFTLSLYDNATLLARQKFTYP